MSEEEKEAIESVKSMFGDITIEKLIKDKIFNITICSLGILDILRVIAIVDNLQKEIEEKSTIIMVGAEKVKQLEKEIEELKENELLEITENFISKDKIREKLKELEEQFKKYENEGLSGFVSKIDKGTRIEVLKELLEEN